MLAKDSMKAKAANGDMTECPRCAGTGLVPAWKKMAPLRKAAGLSARTVAQAMRISPSFLCDLEYGRRSWTAQLGASYLAALAAKDGGKSNPNIAPRASAERGLKQT